MSILKSILHRYNTTNQNYDTLHPETEHAQVTDFGQGVIAHLASSTLVSLVTSVSTGSVFGKMVEKLLEASGVQYNFTNANAWYICLGSLFGGLIIQGGNDTTDSTAGKTVYYPIAFNNSCKTIVSPVVVRQQIVTIMAYNESYFGVVAFNTTSGDYITTGLNFNWLAIGR